MNGNNEVDSDTDVSSNSSWTVLGETSVLTGTGDGKLEDEGTGEIAFTISTPEIFPELEILQNDTLMQTPPPPPADLPCSEKHFQDISCKSEIREEEENTDVDGLIHYGCLTLEEYLRERELEYDYEYDAKRVSFDEIADEKTKPEKRKRKKCKAESVGTLAIIGTVLAIAGVSFLCLLTPNKYVLTDKEIEKIKLECNTTAAALTTNNDPVEVHRVLASDNENKLTVVDREATLENCFRKNTKSPQHAKKYLKSHKHFKVVKTLDLLDDDTPKNISKPSGPLTYEEFLRRNKEYVGITKTDKKDLKNATGENSLFLKTDGETTLSVTEEPLHLMKVKKRDIQRQGNDEQTRVLKALTTKEKVIKRKAGENTLIKKRNSKGISNTSIVVQPPEDSEIESAKQLLFSNVIMNEVKKNKTSSASYGVDAQKGYVYSSSNGKLVCNVLQDIMLLRMTSKIARQLRVKKEAKLSNINKKNLRLKKQNQSTTSIVESKGKLALIKRKKQIDHKEKEKNFRTSLKLLNELPFSEEKTLKTNGILKIDKRSSGSTKNNTRKPHACISLTKGLDTCDKSSVTNKHQEITYGKCKSLDGIAFNLKKDINSREKLNRDIENLRRKQNEYLEKLKKQQADRLEYLRIIRERQQQSIEALIGERRMRFFKDVGCGKYDVPIPSAEEVERRLSELKNRHCHFNCSSKLSCCFSNKRRNLSEIEIADIKNSCNTDKYCRIICECEESATKYDQLQRPQEKMRRKIAGASRTLDNHISNGSGYDKQNAEVKKCTENVQNVCYTIPPEYTEMKKKYCDCVESYWRKREEYLNQRIDFMNQVSNSIKEILNNHRNNAKNFPYNASCSEPVVTKIINEAISAFPDDVDIQKLRILSSSSDTNNALKYGTCLSIRAPECCSIKAGSSKVNVDSSVFEFTAKQCEMAPSKDTNIKKNAMYNSLFGKKGQYIRKRDMALWNSGKISKRKRLREISKHDLRRLSGKRESKKTLERFLP